MKKFIKENWLRVGLLIVLLITVSGCSNSSTTTIGLQEKCSEKAKEFFDNYDAGVSTKDKYSNHYNEKLDKCFVLMATYNEGKAGYVEGNYLYNVYENISVGYKAGFKGEKPYSCNVGESNCDWNNEEWGKLIKPYMEE